MQNIHANVRNKSHAEKKGHPIPSGSKPMRDARDSFMLDSTRLDHLYHISLVRQIPVENLMGSPSPIPLMKGVTRGGGT